MLPLPSPRRQESLASIYVRTFLNGLKRRDLPAHLRVEALPAIVAKRLGGVGSARKREAPFSRRSHFGEGGPAQEGRAIFWPWHWLGTQKKGQHKMPQLHLGSTYNFHR